MSELAQAIAILRDAYPRADFPDRTIRLYGAMLGNADPALVTRAVERLIRTSEFLPTVAAIQNEVAELALNLPTTEEAWEIAERGVLRDAPEPVRRAADHVGGRWAIIHSDNVTTVRAQFRKAYEGCRQQALIDYTTGGRPELAGTRREAISPTMAALPESQHAPAPPVDARAIRRMLGQHIGPPTEAEKAHAIEVLRLGPPSEGDPSFVYAEAERVFAEASS